MNTLKNILPDLSRKSGIGVHYTNHSLRATSITRMFNNGLPEKLIAEMSGHKSVKALRCYERTSSAQQQAVTASVNAVNQDKNLMADKEEKHSSSMEPTSESLKNAAQSFSGNFTNCTINFSLSS